MVRLLARDPAAGLLPVTVGETILTGAPAETITAIAPFPGAGDRASAALAAATGLPLPAPNRTGAAAGRRIVWSGHDQAMLIGPPPGPIEGAALTDQTDGWVLLRLTGPGAVAALARLVPLDLRPSAFPEGAAARSLLNHTPLVIWCEGPDDFALMTFRSMAATAVHELTEALRSADSRSA